MKEWKWGYKEHDPHGRTSPKNEGDTDYVFREDNCCGCDDCCLATIDYGKRLKSEDIIIESCGIGCDVEGSDIDGTPYNLELIRLAPKMQDVLQLHFEYIYDKIVELSN